jgi:paired amphipathic helix protein Sin3a
VKFEDALFFLNEVKVEFGDRPHIYNEFVGILNTFKRGGIDMPCVIRRVSNLFQGNRRFLLGFSKFLPEGYKIELPDSRDGLAVAVCRFPRSYVARVLRELAESQGTRVARRHQPAAAPNALGSSWNLRLWIDRGHRWILGWLSGRAARPMNEAMAHGQPSPQQQQQQDADSMTHDHVINYVTMVEQRFVDEPETYEKFLEILETHDEEQSGVKEVVDEVSVLFEDHPDLLKEFTYFLPDADQAQAKANFDQAAKQAQSFHDATFWVAPSDGVEDLRKKILEKLEVPPEYQQLVFAGRQLKDGRTLSDYDIQNYSTLHLYVRAAGSAAPSSE